MTTMGSEKDKASITLRLKRIEGQLRGIQNMIEQDDDCERIAQQLSAARKGLDRAFYEMMACALKHQLAEQIGKKTQAQARVDEMTGLLAKLA